MKEMENPKNEFSGFSKFKLLDFNKEMFLDSRIQIWIPLPPPPKKNVHKVTALYIESPLRCRFSQQNEVWDHLMKNLILFCSFFIYMTL